MHELQKITALETIIKEQKLTLSQISHEIRNPVTLINSSLQLIEKQHPEVQSFSFWTDVMHDLRYLLLLLDEVSSYNNTTVLNRVFLDVGDWLKKDIASLKAVLSPSYHFTFQIPEQLPRLYADPVKLRQALSNLLRNAFESLGSEGTVRLTVSASETDLSFCVSDTGCGIPREYFSTIYDPFVTHKPNGTGLGLPITKRIVEAHGGTLELASSPEQGTSFTMHLPLSL